MGSGMHFYLPTAHLPIRRSAHTISLFRNNAQKKLNHLEIPT